MSPDLDRSTAFDYLDHHARATPDRTALIGPGRRISWARFRADAALAAQALGKIGLQPGQIAAISHRDSYLHWLLTIACEEVGAISASFEAHSPDDNGQLLALAHCILTEERIAALLADSGSAAGFYRRRPADPETPIRLARTSGSTGTPKCLILRRRTRNHWIRSIMAHNFAAPETRYYAAYPMTANPNYYRMETCLRLGATVILGTASQDIVTFQATHCWLLPRDMKRLADGVRRAWPSAPPPRMILGGGPVSTALYDQTAALLGSPPQILYGINETGFIGTLDREGTVTPLPGVTVKIADDGRIAVRTAGMAEGYVNDPETTEANFRAGWFHSDDLGLQLGDGRFRILGRQSDIINLGGEKLAPAAIEERLRTGIDGLQDLAVTSIVNAHGIEEICVAIVPAPSVPPGALIDRVRAAIDPGLGQVWLLPLDQLPVGGSGKLQRSALREIFAARRK